MKNFIFVFVVSVICGFILGYMLCGYLNSRSTANYVSGTFKDGYVICDHMKPIPVWLLKEDNVKFYITTNLDAAGQIGYKLMFDKSKCVFKFSGQSATVPQ